MQPQFWIGIVEDKNDPEYRGRIRCRILGVHTKETVLNKQTGVGIPTEDLPWALCMMPLTFGGVSTSTVAPPAVQEGAWVFGISLDGDAFSNLIVLGVISLNFHPLATNPGGGDASLAEAGEEMPVAQDGSCMDKYMAVIENIETGGKNDNTERSSAGALGVMQMKPGTMIDTIKYLKKYEPEKYKKFCETSGLTIDSSNIVGMATQNTDTSRDLNRTLGKSLFQHNLEVYNGNPVLAALAYNQGVGGANKLLAKYGNPAKGECTYEEFVARMKAGGVKEASGYVEKFMKQTDQECIQGSQPPVTNAGWAYPTNHKVITSKFGPRNVKGGSNPHLGIDVRAYQGEPIYAFTDGTVKSVDMARWGMIVIDHGNGFVGRYLHCDSTNVKAGQKVKAGDTIAAAGGRGPSGRYQYVPHLHFDMTLNGGSRIDPEPFLAKQGITFTRKAGA